MRAQTGFFINVAPGGTGSSAAYQPANSSSSSSGGPSSSSYLPPSTIFGGARKGAKTYQEDSYFSFSSANNKVIIGGVLDGHGGFNGMVASNIARDSALRFANENSTAMEHWSVDEWKHRLADLFDRMHTDIRVKFLADSGNGGSGSESFLDGEKRSADEKGIVRASNGDPIHGGTTSTLVVLIRSKDKATIITANVGDSTALLLPSKSSKCEFLTVDHGPESPEEYARIAALDTKHYPCKLLLVYDKTNVFRKYECPCVFASNGEKDPLFVNNPWGNGLHPTNVRYEPAVYAVTPKSVSKDSTCIAMTRALGDFYAHQFGLTHIPSITVRNIDHNEEQYSIILASDGIWDCWKYEEFCSFVNDCLQRKKRNIQEVGEDVLDESISRAITNFGSKHYDDACAVFFAAQ